MAKGYWVVFADVTDPEGYRGYVAANAKALSKYTWRAAVKSSQRKVNLGRALWSLNSQPTEQH
jgi:uncharacterized protein (DUF1330 family)